MFWCSSSLISSPHRILAAAPPSSCGSFIIDHLHTAGSAPLSKYCAVFFFLSLCLTSHDHLLQVDEYSPAVACQEIICVVLPFLHPRLKNVISRRSARMGPEYRWTREGFLHYPKCFTPSAAGFFSEGWECHFSCSLQERFTLMGETCRLISRKTCRGVCLSHHGTDSQHEVSRADSREESQVSMCTLAGNTIKAALITIINV